MIANGADGTSTLTKAGPGTLILSGINTYTGQTYVNGGLLSIGAANNISSANLNINGGGIEALESFTLPTLYIGSDGATLNATGSNVLTVGSTSGTGNYSNPSTGALTVNGDGSTGTVFLNTSSNQNGNAFYGGIIIGGGTLKLLSNYSSFGVQGSDGDSATLGTTPANYISWTPTSSGVLMLNGTPGLVAGLESLSANAVVENGSTTPTSITPLIFLTLFWPLATVIMKPMRAR